MMRFLCLRSRALQRVIAGLEIVSVLFESTAATNVNVECANPTSLISNPVFSILFDGPVCAGETVCTVFMSPVPIGPPKTAR